MPKKCIGQGGDGRRERFEGGGLDPLKEGEINLARSGLSEVEIIAGGEMMIALMWECLLWVAHTPTHGSIYFCKNKTVVFGSYSTYEYYEVCTRLAVSNLNYSLLAVLRFENGILYHCPTLLHLLAARSNIKGRCCRYCEIILLQWRWRRLSERLCVMWGPQNTVQAVSENHRRLKASMHDFNHFTCHSL